MQTTHMATPVLEVAHLEKVYGALGNVTRALNDVSFTVNRGEFVGIMGASGSGKDSLLQALRPRLRGVPVAFARRYITRPLSAKGERHIAARERDQEKAGALRADTPASRS